MDPVLALVVAFAIFSLFALAMTVVFFGRDIHAHVRGKEKEAALTVRKNK